jgi:FAD/FMN-containing dehydrogenase/Fe-S oxidoreductase
MPQHDPDKSSRHDLAAELKRVIRGEVRFDAGSRALYAHDGSNYRQVPIGVVVPRDEDDVELTVAICRRYDAPLLPRGAGTSLAGQSCNVAVVVDMSKYMRRIIELNPAQGYARIQPGTNLDQLRNAAEVHHLTFGPDPATHSQNTLGGMIGNNSCGIHSVMAGKTDDNIEALEIITYDGLRMWVGPTSDDDFARIVAQGGRRAEIYSALKSLRDRYADLIRKRYPQIPRMVSGYNLRHLLSENDFHVARALVGSEGTCVTVLQAVTRLVHSPPFRCLAVLGYPDVYAAGDHVPDIMNFGPLGLEGMDENLIRDMQKKKLHPENVKLLPDGRGWLLVEFGGQSKQEAIERAEEMLAALKKQSNPPHMKIFADPKEEDKVWEIRESGLGATARVPGSKDTWPGWEDSAVHPEHVGKYLRDLRALLDKYSYNCSLYGHFGQGCIHCRIDFDLLTRPGIEHYKAFVDEAADTAMRYQGSFSGEHGDGQSRAALLPKMFGPELIQAFREFKTIWDPQWKMNPGKIIDPYPLDANLRLGTGYNPPVPRSHFHFHEDRGSFPYATLRCVGVGKCRAEASGTMCPSYMATREEMHSTRGRARLLFEMFQGQALQGGWREEKVREALDLCLSCKSCLGECPVNVDMAKYKAEFMSHYYRHRLRPADAYSMGLIYWWCRLAAGMPRAANFFARTQPFADVLKKIGGISTRRQFPPFASQTFRRLFLDRPIVNRGRPLVILWADTFNNHFYPNVALAGMQVLEQCGFQVIVPREPLCCGRPLFDYGMLDLAKSLLRRVLKVLGPWIEAGIPLVGLEPACLSTFRDELPDLFPHDQNAHRLSRQAFLLSEFLQHKAPEFNMPKLAARALVHGHCTHKSVMHMDHDETVMARLGLDYQILDSGCCGISGAFGFRKGNYEISLAIGERVLLPAVRQAPPDTLIVADGFSCREQIAHCTDREALHLAQVILMAMESGGDQPMEDYPERRFARRSISPRRR